MRKSDSLIFEISKTQLVVIFVYYFLMLLIGGVLLITTLCELSEDMSKKQIIIKTVISSLSASGMLCSLQYIKRLYKACITNRIVQNSTFAGSIGNLVYFISRPFFAFAFVVIMIYALLSGMFGVTGCLDYIINEKFLYLCVILSSFIGYSVGRVLDKFENISKEQIIKSE